MEGTRSNQVQVRLDPPLAAAQTPGLWSSRSPDFYGCGGPQPPRPRGAWRGGCGRTTPSRSTPGCPGRGPAS